MPRAWMTPRFARGCARDSRLQRRHVLRRPASTRGFGRARNWREGVPQERPAVLGDGSGADPRCGPRLLPRAFRFDARAALCRRRSALRDVRARAARVGHRRARAKSRDAHRPGYDLANRTRASVEELGVRRLARTQSERRRDRARPALAKATFGVGEGRRLLGAACGAPRRARCPSQRWRRLRALVTDRRFDARRARVLHPQSDRLGAARGVEATTRSDLRVSAKTPRARIEALAPGRREVPPSGEAEGARSFPPRLETGRARRMQPTRPWPGGVGRSGAGAAATSRHRCRGSARTAWHGYRSAGGSGSSRSSRSPAFAPWGPL